MTLRIKRIQDIDLNHQVWGSEGGTGLLTDLQWHSIAHSPWSTEYPYCPEVRFQAGHSKENIYLHYEVREQYLKAQYVRINEQVWEDSCVEFFLSLDGRKTYYNIEFNVLGTGLVGYGTAVKSERKRLEAHLTAQISTLTQVSNIAGEKSWRMLMVIPKLIFNKEIPLETPVHANFYKCGDGLPEPHYLAWNNIENPTPNFHLPAFFGEVVFEK